MSVSSKETMLTASVDPHRIKNLTIPETYIEDCPKRFYNVSGDTLTTLDNVEMKLRRKTTLWETFLVITFHSTPPTTFKIKHILCTHYSVEKIWSEGPSIC